MKKIKFAETTFTKVLSGRGKFVVLAGALVLAALSVIGILNVTENYDLSTYLPAESNTRQGLVILDEEFGAPATVQVMIEDISIPDVLSVKSELKALPEVKSVVWLDDISDITLPLDQLDEETVSQYYVDGAALFTVQFFGDDYSAATEKGIAAVRTLLASYPAVSIRGEALANIETRSLTRKEINTVILVIVPICLLILLLGSTSWLEPIFVLVTLGIAILLNMGTNVIFTSVSFITISMAAVLQLAISLDYSLFLVHRYFEERELGQTVLVAVVTATKRTFSSIVTSALTTIVGFLALLLMSYSIGSDIGLVLAKGVVFSFLCTMTILPVFLVLFGPLLEKTRHRNFVPSFKRIAKPLYKGRHAIAIGIVVLAAGGFFFQSNLGYYYGNNQASNTESAVAVEASNIENKFGTWEPIVILVPKGSLSTEEALVTELRNIDHVTDIQALVTFVDPEIPESLIPAEVISQFQGPVYSRIILNTDIETEDEQMFDFSTNLKTVVSSFYQEYYLVGVATSIADIKTTVINDTLWVMIASIGAIALILILMFRSIFIPALLIGVIETSVWANFAIPYLQGTSIAFIGYLVVSSMQLGATIDYAVLLTSRYREARAQMPIKEAMTEAVAKSSKSILVSGIILTVAGFVLGFTSQVAAVKEMGILIGRGAAFSILMVLFALPPLLAIFDRFIIRRPRLSAHHKEKKANE